MTTLRHVPDGVLVRAEWVLRGGAREPPAIGTEPAGACVFGWDLRHVGRHVRLRRDGTRARVEATLRQVRVELARRLFGDWSWPWVVRPLFEGGGESPREASER
jgi:hypothetical protein